MIATLSFSLKISIYPLYHSIGAMIHKLLLPDRVHPPNQFVPEIVSHLPCSSGLARHKLLFVYIFKELISFIGSLHKCHTSVFNALILHTQRPVYLVMKSVVMKSSVYDPSVCVALLGIL